MRISKQIIGWLVITAGVAWSLYDWTFVDNALGFFASDWRRILLLAVLSIGGGFAVAGFMRLPAVARQRFVTASFAVGAVSATWCCGYFIWQFIRLRALLVDKSLVWLLALMGVGSVVLLAFVWLSFWCYSRKVYGHRQSY
jgi:hypothetical protein